MNLEQKKKILSRIVKIEADIEELNRVRMELVSSAYASATLASGGGSKSYTRLDVDKVTATITQLKIELKNMRSMLNGSATGTPRIIQNIWF